MKKIVINQIIMCENWKLQLDMEVLHGSAGDIGKINKYTYYLEETNEDFYHIENNWLPFELDMTEEYRICIKDKLCIVANQFVYTNLCDGLDIREAIIIFRRDLKEHLIGVYDVNEKSMKCKNKELQRYFEKLLSFNRKIFHKNVSFRVYCLKTVFEAVSFKNVIVLDTGYLERPYTYMYKVLPHELFHQINGCQLKFSGRANEWMRESFVEYLQLLFIKESISSDFFKRQKDIYKKFESELVNCNISVWDFDMFKHVNLYNRVIYGRGVMIFYEIFGDNLFLISDFVERLYLVNGRIEIETYINQMSEVVGLEKESIKKKLCYIK